MPSTALLLENAQLCPGVYASLHLRKGRCSPAWTSWCGSGWTKIDAIALSWGGRLQKVNCSGDWAQWIRAVWAANRSSSWWNVPEVSPWPYRKLSKLLQAALCFCLEPELSNYDWALLIHLRCILVFKQVGGGEQVVYRWYCSKLDQVSSVVKLFFWQIRLDI